MLHLNVNIDCAVHLPKYKTQHDIHQSIKKHKEKQRTKSKGEVSPPQVYLSWESEL